MKRIIINADDFGLTDGCNEGIIKAIKKGVVTSTTVMMNMPYAKEGIDKLKTMNFQSVGIHLTLTCGTPTLPSEEVSSLTDEENKFFKRKEKLFPNMYLDEVEKELRNQIELFIKTGLKPTHLDSHHHIHIYDGVREIVCKLAKEYNLPLRHVDEKTKSYLNINNIMTTDKFSMDFYGGKVQINTLKRILSSFDGDALEIMVHPAIIDEELVRVSSYNKERVRELEILTSDEIKRWIDKKSYVMIGYDNL